MNELAFERDDRHTEPGETGHFQARFTEGWRKAAEGGVYTADTLRDLTWDNLGYRLGRLFGNTDPDLVEEMYEWCVRRQKRSS